MISPKAEENVEVVSHFESGRWHITQRMSQTSPLSLMLRIA